MSVIAVQQQQIYLSNEDSILEIMHMSRLFLWKMKRFLLNPKFIII